MRERKTDYPKTVDAIRRLLLLGRTPRQIAKELGVRRQRVRWHRVQLGLPPFKPGRVYDGPYAKPAVAARVAFLKQCGMSLSEAAKALYGEPRGVALSRSRGYWRTAYWWRRVKA